MEDKYAKHQVNRLTGSKCLFYKTSKRYNILFHMLTIISFFFFFDTLQLLLPTSDERKKLYQGTDAQN